MPKYVAQKCPCGDSVCEAWHVWPVAAVQSVRFTREQAEAVAKLLNEMAKQEEK
jgi:acetone carboxylase gamma subunit